MTFLLVVLSCPDCLGRRLGPRLLGRVDDSGVSIPFSPYRNYSLDLSCGQQFIYDFNLSWSFVVIMMVQQRLVKDFYKILNQVNTEEIPGGLKLPDSFSQLVSEMKNNQYDAKTFAFMLRAMVWSFYVNYSYF